MGSYIDAVRAWHQNFLSGQSRCLLPSEKGNKPHVKSIQHAAVTEGPFIPSRFLKSRVLWFHLHPFFSSARWPSVSISTRYYLYKHFRSARWEIHTLFCPDPHVSLRKAVFVTISSSEDEHDLGTAVVLVLGGTCWNEKIPHKEIRHKLSAEVACSVSFFFFLRKCSQIFLLHQPKIVF